MEKLKNLWYKLPAKVRNHLISAIQTFFVVFFALLQTGIENENTLTWAFIASVARAAIREVVYQSIKLINKK